MSNIPSFLGKSGVKEISHLIFTDLQLDSLLSPAARKILSYPCCGEEIKRRQELFGIISSDESKLEQVKSNERDHTNRKRAPKGDACHQHILQRSE